MNHEHINIEPLIHHFWLDHLEIFSNFKDHTLFESLDFDNSHEGNLDDYIIEKHEVPKYKYKITFRKNKYTYFAYYVGIPRSSSQPVGTRNYIVVYSTAFRLLEYEEILWFLEWYLELFHCRRFDICIDLKIETHSCLETYFPRFHTGVQYRKSGLIETQYFWELKNSINKRQLIRIYNKLRDSSQKNKFELYSDYFQFENMTRIELEVRQELAKELDYRELFYDDVLLWVFKNYLKKETEIFEPLPWTHKTLYRDKKSYRYINGKKIEITAEDYQSMFYKTKRKNIFLWHAKTIFHMWFCPVRVLIWEGYIQPKTKSILGWDLVEHILSMEMKLKQEHFLKKKQRKDFQNLLDNSPEYENNGE